MGRKMATHYQLKPNTLYRKVLTLFTDGIYIFSMSKDICKLPNCNSKPFTKGSGLCRPHYRRQNLYGDPYFVKTRPGKPLCSVEGCNNLNDARRLCSKHYRRLVLYGNTDTVRTTQRFKYNTSDYRPERNTYGSMIHRCYKRPGASYEGITICDRWLDKDKGFDNFVDDMGRRPEGYSLDRIDPRGPYSPENCRWANSTTQGRNRMDTTWFLLNGKTLCGRELRRTKGYSNYRSSKGMKVGDKYKDAVFIGRGVDAIGGSYCA